MDSYPSASSSKFVELLNSQQTVSFGNYEDSVELSSSQLSFQGSFGTEASNFDGDTATERRERQKWTPKDNILLISSCLNTSKDAVVGNEQRSGGFWSRIAAYVEASRESQATGGGCEQREPHHCKQRWHRINDLVSKFCGAYEAATREKSSGKNDNDVLKLAHQIFYNNHEKKFTLEHCWKELRNDQKWCDLATAKRSSSKKRKCEDGGDSSASQATENKHPPGVKATKASSKKKVVEENSLNGFQSMWTIKQHDLLIKEQLSKMSLLDSLPGKKELLAEYEEALKAKLINDLMSS
ncbi:PREDICTED: glutathione S-transferase T2-like [Brassica oleracea var. oleracea]|uniref:Myb-like domain-containing protein n=1 Tax=Brassica oleracea var. oleracea TaxID=109376 RepID=A0A0D3CB47_BRAOL|nr:PREDICTED: glutathione S-transferase T2-like [Brassica oleracea var. oleracea]